MFLIDQEGELSTVDVNAKFLNGKPQGIEATYVMKSTNEWNRFMRFMERYAEDNGLGFAAFKSEPSRARSGRDHRDEILDRAAT